MDSPIKYGTRKKYGDGNTYGARVMNRASSDLAGEITLHGFHKLFAICKELDGALNEGSRNECSQDDVIEDKYQGLTAWLGLAQPLLPVRSHSKITRPKLTRFVWDWRSWFRVKDFEDYFGVDRKTAWEYLQKFLDADLLTHNQEKSSRARYRVNLPAEA